jgi:ferredoxin
MKVCRKIIKIDEEKCDGCGLCIPGCPEGALQIIKKSCIWRFPAVMVWCIWPRRP